MPALPRAIVTRPAQEAQAWVADLRAAGLDAVAMPLIDIGPAPDSAALANAWGQIHTYDAVMFVSANAASQFFALRPPGTRDPFGPSLRAWATGPGTHGALAACGVPHDAIDAPPVDGAQFDSEALWQVVRSQVVSGKRVLIVRGRAAAEPQATPSPQGSGRDWLAQHVESAGGRVDFVVAYERRAPVWSTEELEWVAQRACDGSVWILSSAQGLGYLLEAAPHQEWQGARALATHPRIAAAARQAGFGRVQVARPVLADIVASIESQA